MENVLQKEKVLVIKPINEVDYYKHDELTFTALRSIVLEEYRRQVINSMTSYIKRMRSIKDYMGGSLASIERNLTSVKFEDYTQTRRIKTGNVFECSIRRMLGLAGFAPISINEMDILDVFGKGTIMDCTGIYKDTGLGIEIKSNLNLDTEKSVAVIERVNKTEIILSRIFPQVQSVLVSLTYPTRSYIPNNILNKYKPIKSNVFGFQEMFNAFDIHISLDKWYSLIKELKTLAEEVFVNIMAREGAC